MTRMTYLRRSSRTPLVAFVFAALWSASNWSTCAANPPDFANQIYPILQRNCIACHNAQKTEGKLNLESFEALAKGGESGAAFAVGKASESEIVARVKPDSSDIMPPDGNTVGAKRLTPDEINLLTAWIDSGAAVGVAAKAAMNWRALPDSVRPIYAVDATSDGQFVAVGRGNSAVVYRWPNFDGPANATMLIDPAVQSQLHTTSPATHLDLVQSVAINNEATRIATGGYRDVKIWNRVAGTIADEVVSRMQGTTTFAASPDGLSFARATSNPGVEVCSSDNAAIRFRLESPLPSSGLSWSRDSKEVTSMALDGTVLVYTLPAIDPNQVLPVQPRHNQKLESGFTKLQVIDGTGLVGITPDKKLQLWIWMQPAPDQPAQLVKSDKFTDVAEVNSIALYFDPAPKLVIGISDGSIRVASLPDGAVIRTIAHGAPLRRVAAANDNSKLVSIGIDGLIKAWNVADGNMLWEHRFDKEVSRKTQLADLRVARQQVRVDRATAKVPELEKAKQSEMESKEKLQKTRNEAAEALSKKQTELESNDKLVADSEAAVTAAKQAVEEAMKKVGLAQKDLETKKTQRMVAEKAKLEAEMKVATIDKTIASAGQAIERAVALISDFQAKLEQEKSQLGAMLQEATQVKGAAAAVPAVDIVVSADSKSIVSAHQDGLIQVLRADKGTPQLNLRGAFAELNGMMMTPAGRVYVATNDGRSLGWAAGNQWVLERVIGNAEQSPLSDRVTAMDFSDDGNTLAVGSGAPSRFGELKIFSLADGAVVRDYGQVHSDSILSVKFSPDGKMLATGAADKLVRLHSVAEDRPTKTLEGHTHHVLGIAWHDDGYWLASSSADNTVKIWDVEAGQATRTIPGFGKEVTSLAFVGRTNQLFSTSADQQSRLHDAANGNLIRAMGGPGDAVYAGAVAGTNPLGIAGGQDGVLWIWQLDNGQALQQIK